MPKDNLSWEFNLIDRTGSEFTVDGEPLEFTYNADSYDYKKFTLQEAFTELKNDCIANDLLLGKKLFVKSIYWTYFDHEIGDTSSQPVRVDLINEKYVWGSVYNLQRGLGM